ncbi:CHAT domain-containing protein [Halorussus salinisoli]|uniref:hypothetical protein n=1 Tax=Halorussus salinisoli TaxID=2558242 RepID=UPI0010C1C897|nr:hypothetical protein [Halorussus salinisoli]
MHPEFDSLTTTAGIEILDPIESRRFTLRTTTPIAPMPATTDGFPFPVDTACEIRTDELALPYTIPVDVRSPDGSHHASISPPTRREFPPDEYLLDFHAPMKLYLRVGSSLEIAADADDVTIDFGEATTVRVGARSYHSSPAGTITVPDDPEAVMEAVSAFSSALKTTSPEHAWPTLRGHPPRVERSDELSIPDGLEAPDTGISIEVPPEYGPIYGVAPLAYYLGANLVPSEIARLTTDTGTGVARHLGDDAAEIAETAGDLLKRVLLLDCVTRTEGYFPVELHEREVLEPQVDLDFEALYETPLAERLATYLSVPDEAVDSITPTWHRATHVEPDASAVELLPYVVDDLPLVRIESPVGEAWNPTESQRVTEDALGSFVRRAEPARGDDFVRSADTRAPRSPPDDDSTNGRGVPGVGEYVPLPEVDALEQAYVGDKTPESGSKLLVEAFRNETPEHEEGVIEITVVCNDDEMRAEWDAVSEVYGSRDDVYVDVDCRFDVSTGELRDLLAEDNHVFHFIGHIDGLGFECRDGILDAETVEETGATTVLLNGCRSHDQGIALVEAGANAAVVSLGDVGNGGAVEVGETLAKLLHHGFSVGYSMEIVRKYTSIGRDYLVAGDPGVTITQTETGMPIMYHVFPDETETDGKLVAEFYAYPNQRHGAGSVIESYLPGIEGMFFGVGACGHTEVAHNVLHELLEGRTRPLIVNEELVWSDVWLKEV